MGTRKLNIREALLSVFIFVLIYMCEDTLLFGSNSNKMFRKVSYYILLAIAVALLILTLFNIRKVDKKCLIIATILIAILTINSLVLDDFKNGYGMEIKIYLIFIAFFLVDNFTLKTIFKCFSRVMLILSLVSIIPFVINFIDTRIFGFLPTITNLANTKFYVGGLFNLIIGERHNIRNYGIFREPNIFGLFLILALIYELAIKEKPTMWIVASFVVTIFTTLSLSAFVSLGILLLIFFIKNKDKLSHKVRTAIYSASISIVAIMVGYIIFTFIGGDKIISLKTRLSSIIFNIRVFFKHTIWGTGIRKYDNAIKAAMYGLSSDGGNTPTLLINFAMHGFLYGTLCVVSLFGFVFKLTKNKFINILVLVILAFNLLMSSIIYNFILYIIVIYGLSNLLNTIEEGKGTVR